MCAELAEGFNKAFHHLMFPDPETSGSDDWQAVRRRRREAISTLRQAIREIGPYPQIDDLSRALDNAEGAIIGSRQRLKLKGWHIPVLTIAYSAAGAIYLCTHSALPPDFYPRIHRNSQVARFSSLTLKHLGMDATPSAVAKQLENWRKLVEISPRGK